MNELTITTPEHVPIRLHPAGTASRFLAILIDSTIVVALSVAILSILAYVLPTGIGFALGMTVGFLLKWSWHVWFEVRRQGRTPGKKLMKIRVIDARGLPVSLYQSLVRNITRVLDFAPAFYGLGAIAVLATPARRRLGDLVADTLVVRDAQPLVPRGVLGAERRHNTLRTPRVQRLARHRIGLEEREFLVTLCLKADRMSAEARYDIMEEVASAYRKKLEVEEEQISGENFVRDLTAVLFHPVR